MGDTNAAVQLVLLRVDCSQRIWATLRSGLHNLKEYNLLFEGGSQALLTPERKVQPAASHHFLGDGA